MEAVLDALKSVPVVFLDAPTGTGKSIIAKALMELWQWPIRDGGISRRSVLATKTIQLQEQYLRDFPDLGLLKGRANYPCPIGHRNAADAPCATGGRCSLRNTTECPYYAVRSESSSAPSLIVNYDLLMTQLPSAHSIGHPLHSRTLLIGDEGHLAEDSIRSAGSVNVSEWLLREAGLRTGLGHPRGLDRSAWEGWAEAVLECLPALPPFFLRRDVSPTEFKALYPLIQIKKVANGILDLKHDTCVVREQRNGVTVEPVFADRAFSRVRRTFERVVLMSATLPAPATYARLLGLTSNEYATVSLPALFPVVLRPLYYSNAVPVKREMTADALDRLVEIMDIYIDRWNDDGRKGIIHCHAYWLRDALLHRSRHAGRLITHDARGLATAVASFRAAAAGTYLLSPTAHSGVDLPYDHVRAQIILKLPTPDLRDPVVQARREADPDFYDTQIAATLVQMYGRGVRADDDWCDSVILDANFGRWWYPKNKNKLPSWFVEAVQPCR